MKLNTKFQRALLAGLTFLACGQNTTDIVAGNANANANANANGDTEEFVFVTSTVVFSDEGTTSYVSLMDSLGDSPIDLKQAREFSGWSAVWTLDDKVFVSNGESPTMTRFSVDKNLNYNNEGQLSFVNHGANSADSGFIGTTKGYVTADADVVIWNPERMEISGTFPLPDIADQDGGMQFGGLRTGRSFVTRGSRAYIAASWANWDEYAVSETSLIVVIDAESDQIIETITAPCPYLDVATIGDDGTLYFSNWVYSVGQTLLSGKKKACAVRILPNEESIDSDWTLTFADVTDGREAAALRYLGDGKALLSVYYHDRVDWGSNTSPEELADADNWRAWILDLETFDTNVVTQIPFNAGGFNFSRVGDSSFALVPDADYESTDVYEVAPDGSAKRLWVTPGWGRGLDRLRLTP